MSKFDFKHPNIQLLLPALLALLLAFVLVFLFVSITIPPASIPPSSAGAKRDPHENLPERGLPIPPLDVRAMLRASKELSREAKGIYALRCASCHGLEGVGNGPAGMQLNPPPRNFTVESGWKSGYKVSQIFETLSDGLGGMPSFDDLSPRERFALAHYVQSLGEFSASREETEAVSYLEQKYALSKGSTSPNKIPLSLAEKLLISEQPQYELQMPGPGQSAPDVLAVVQNPQRVATMLSRSSLWRSDPAFLLRIAATGAPTNGFSPSVGAFNKQEAKLLHSELSARLKLKGGSQ